MTQGVEENERVQERDHPEDLADHDVTIAVVLRTQSSRTADLLEDIEGLAGVRLVYCRVRRGRIWVSDEDSRGSRP